MRGIQQSLKVPRDSLPVLSLADANQVTKKEIETEEIREKMLCGPLRASLSDAVLPAYINQGQLRMLRMCDN